MKNRNFYLSDVPGSENSFSQPRETFFSTNFSFRLVETNFLSCRNSIVSFRALWKILKFGGSNLFKRNIISARGNWFFWLVKVNFLSSRNVFLTNFSFRMVETDFWSCGNYFLLFNFFFLQVETFTEIGKDFVPVERDFPPSGNCFLLFRASFLQVETVTETSWNKKSLPFINGRI